MGTQIHAGDNYRRVVELVQSGAIGPVERVHVWHGNCGRGPGEPGSRGNEAPGQHRLRPVDRRRTHAALDPSLPPVQLEPLGGTSATARWATWAATRSICRFGLGLRKPPRSRPTAKALHGRQRSSGLPDRGPPVPGAGRSAAGGAHLVSRQPQARESSDMRGAAVLFEGTRGRLLADYETRQLFMTDGLPVSMPDRPIRRRRTPPRRDRACKTARADACNFDYSGALAEAVLLGNVDRAGQQRIEWDSDKLAATNCPAAAKFLRAEYRQGWSLG